MKVSRSTSHISFSRRIITSVSLIDQFVIIALLIAAVAADEAYPKPAYSKSYDYVSSITTPSIPIESKHQ